MRTAAALLLTLAACTSTPTAQPPISGTASMRPVQSVPDIDPAPRQTTTTTTTAPPTTTTTTLPSPVVKAAAVAPPVTQQATGACGGWRDLIASHFPADQVDKACAVMLCESNGNPNAVSPTDDHGLFQINRRYNPTAPWHAIYDPTANTAYAADLWRRAGWNAWACA